MDGLEISTRLGCAVGCQYCPHEKPLRAQEGHSFVGYMSMFTYVAAVNQVPQDQGIFFSGFCEPSLNHDWVNMIVHAAQAKHPVYVNTTLHGATPEEINGPLGRVPYMAFMVHLPDVKMRWQVDTDYLNKLNALRALNIPSIQWRQHYALQPIVEDYVRQTGLKITPMWTHSRAGHVSSFSKAKSNLKCTNDNRHILLPNGDVVLCCMDYGLEHKLGNLITDSWEDIKEAQKLTEDAALCQRCIYTRGSDAIH